MVTGARSFVGRPQSQLGGGLPKDRTGVIPTPTAGTGVPPGQDSRVSTCYTAGGMPLTVTQEEFLVSIASVDQEGNRSDKITLGLVQLLVAH